MFGLHRMVHALWPSTSRTAMTGRRIAFARCTLRPAVLVVLGLAGLSCADSSNYLYRPAENATAMTDGYAAARYSIPVASPHGDVRIASFGVRGVAQEENGREWPAVHVRMIVANQSGAAAWTVDPNEVLIEVRGEKPKPPAVVNVDGSDAPQIRIAPGEQRTLDFFYPLAEDQDDASNVPAFDVLWTVHTDTMTLTQRTPFERLAPVQTTASVGMGMGYSPYWWSNPWYSSYPMNAGPGLVGPGLLGPSIMAPSMGSRFYVQAHPGLRH